MWPAVQAELNRLAHRYMRHERPNYTLETGALVNEAYMRLVDWQNAEWENRDYFSPEGRRSRCSGRRPQAPVSDLSAQKSDC